MGYFKSAEFYETIIVILFAVLIFGLGNLADKRYLKSKRANHKWYNSTKAIIDLIRAIIAIIFALIILSINGVNVGKYVASLGVIGIVLSFALQDILKDIIMGLSIMFEGYFKVGDVVVYQGREGKVISFNIKTTKLFMLDTEERLSVCNREINQISVASDWVDVDVPIGYDIDLNYSRFLCKECAKRIERLRHVYSCDFLNTQELSESWINYKLRVHCLPEKKPPVRRNAQAVIQDVFYEYGCEFPLSIKVLYNVDQEKKIAIDGSIIKTKPDESSIVTNAVKKKTDYELGRGAEKSKVIAVDGSDEAIAIAMAEAERYARSENLGEDMKLKIRLLSEELLLLTKNLSNMKNGVFYIERDDADYDILFEADAKVSKNTREMLLDVSSTGTNEAYSGIGGMVAKAVDSMILMGIDDRKGISKVSADVMEQSIGKSDDDYRWSYNIYMEKEAMDTENGEVMIDENAISQSVLTSLSEDIKISVRTNHVSIRVLVAPSDDDNE